MRTKTLAKVVISFLLVYVLANMSLVAQDGTKKERSGENSSGQESPKRVFDPVPGGKYAEPELILNELEAAIKILNNYDEQPGWKIDLATCAYTVFAEQKNVRFEDLIADTAFSKIFDSLNFRLLGGPMLGQVSEAGATVWVRTYGPANVMVQVKGRRFSGTYGPVVSKAGNDFAVEVPISGLKPDREYEYTVLIDGEPVTDAGGVLKTADPKNTRIVFGSCPHRWGLANPSLWNTVLSRSADAFLAYGDVAVQDRHFEFGMHRFDYLLRELHDPWRNLVANLPVYVSWDDHDYYDNDHWGLGKRRFEEPDEGTDADRLGIRKIFQDSWSNPSYGFNNEKGGIFFRTRIGAADVIMTDNRYFRGTDGPFLGEGQMKWLEEQLLQCQGPFIIITCGTLWSDYKAQGKDSWGVFDPEGRERILNFIEENNIPGVLLLSGDWHGARGFTIERPSGYTFYEFQPASLGGRGRHDDPETQKNKPVEEHWQYSLRGNNAFGEFTFNTRRRDPTVTYRLILDDGSEYYKIELSRSQLTPDPKRR